MYMYINIVIVNEDYMWVFFFTKYFDRSNDVVKLP